MNGVLHHYKHYFSHVNVTAYTFMCSWDSSVLSWNYEVFCSRTLPREIQRTQCSSNPGPPVMNHTLPLSHTGSLPEKKKVLVDSIVSFSVTVFRKLIPLGHEKIGLVKVISHFKQFDSLKI